MRVLSGQMRRRRPRGPTRSRRAKNVVAARGHLYYRGELVTVAYDKLFAITSCVAGVQELVVAAQRNIADLEKQLIKPLRRNRE